MSSPAAPLVETAAAIAAAVAAAAGPVAITAVAAVAAVVAVALGTRPSSIRRAWIFVFLGERKQQRKFSPNTLHHLQRAIRS